ncbi:hypothetical protein CBS9595_000741 [Malassezia furfur]|nr:hypothetical protein CBS9595_000741 [Malassezia furfur]
MARRLTILARGIPLLGALVALNAVLWVITAVTFSVFQHRIKGKPDETTRQAEKLLSDNADDVAKRSGTLLSFALVAWATGLRHALDADHISAIDNATRRIMAVPRKHGPGFQRPVTVGLWFSLGHSTIVVAVLIAIAVSFTVYARMNTVSDVGGIIGASVSGSFLFIIGVINSIILIRSIHSLRMERKRVRDAEHNAATADIEVAPKDGAAKAVDAHKDTMAQTEDAHKDTAAQAPSAAHDTAADDTLAQSTQVDVHTDPHLHRRTDSVIVEAPKSEEDNAATPVSPGEAPARRTEFRGLFTRLTGPLLRAIDRPWKMYPIGILFGLGFDTASTISLLAIAVIASSSLSGSSEANGSVVLLAFLFTAGMMLADSCDAVLMVCAYAWEELQAQPKWYSIWVEVPDEHPECDHDLFLNDDDAPDVPDMAHEIAVSTTPFTLFLTLLSIIIAFAVSIIEILGLIGSECSQCSAAADRQAETHDGGLAGRWWLWWRWCNDNFGWIGIGITGAFFVAVGIALGVTIYLSKRRPGRRAHL